MTLKFPVKKWVTNEMRSTRKKSQPTEEDNWGKRQKEGGPFMIQFSHYTDSGTIYLLPSAMRNNYTFWVCFLRFYLFIFRKRGREGEREGEKHQCVVASHVPPTSDQACNPGMCPAWELNWQPFTSQASTQPTEPHQPGLVCCFCFVLFCLSKKKRKTKRKETCQTFIQGPSRNFFLGTKVVKNMDFLKRLIWIRSCKDTQSWSIWNHFAACHHQQGHKVLKNSLTFSARLPYLSLKSSLTSSVNTGTACRSKLVFSVLCSSHPPYLQWSFSKYSRGIPYSSVLPHKSSISLQWLKDKWFHLVQGFGQTGYSSGHANLDNLSTLFHSCSQINTNLMQKYTWHALYTSIQKVNISLHLCHWEASWAPIRLRQAYDWKVKDHPSGFSMSIIWRTFLSLFCDVVSSWNASWILSTLHHLATGTGTTSQPWQTCLRRFTNVDFPAVMFPWRGIFLRRVPSELVSGDGQPLLGGVAIPHLVAPGVHLAGRAGSGHRCLHLQQPQKMAWLAGWTPGLCRIPHPPVTRLILADGSSWQGKCTCGWGATVARPHAAPAKAPLAAACPPSKSIHSCFGINLLFWVKYVKKIVSHG